MQDLSPQLVHELTTLCPAMNGLEEINYRGIKVIRVDSSQPLPKHLRSKKPIAVTANNKTIHATFVYSGELQLE